MRLRAVPKAALVVPPSEDAKVVKVPAAGTLPPIAGGELRFSADPNVALVNAFPLLFRQVVLSTPDDERVAAAQSPPPLRVLGA